jgi:TetR/AcrR family transcriptional repressor of mexJK operon
MRAIDRVCRFERRLNDTHKSQYRDVARLPPGVNRRAQASLSYMARMVSAAIAPVSRGPGRPPRALGAQLAEQILDAAEELFLKQGYEATTVEQIAVRIGATKRTIYVRFSDKAQLFHAVVTRVLNARRPKLSSIGTHRTIDERLTDMGTAVLRYVLDPQVVCVLRVVTAEAYRFPELNRMIEEQAAQGIAPAIERMLEEEVRLGRIQLDDIPFSTKLLLSLLTGLPVREAGRGAKPLNQAERQKWVHGAVSLFLDGARYRRD